jgi:hypothetical protein
MRILNILAVVIAIIALFGGGYYKLQAMAKQPALDAINARYNATTTTALRTSSRNMLNWWYIS